ncbi:MAG: hypothetical protein Q8930_17280 [Bacillota bacterium]|nr:hypothetical protein [Bacillota bacterium]
MSDNNKSKDEWERKEENAARIDQLVNIVDHYTRTERHLEEHSDISDPENLAHAKEIQEARKEEIENLKDIIAYGKHENQDEVKNLERNLEYTGNYLKDYKDVMDEKTLERTKEKQAHRQDQMDSLT